MGVPLRNPVTRILGMSLFILGMMASTSLWQLAIKARPAATETPTSVDLATLVGGLDSAREMGHDGIDRYMAKWGGKKLWVNAYLSDLGPWCYELATTPKDGEGASVYAFAGHKIFRSDVPRRSFVVAECRIALTPIDGQPLLLADTDFVKIDYPEPRIGKK